MTCASVAVFGVLVMGGCVALVATTADEAEVTVSAEDEARVAVGLALGLMEDAERAELCEAVALDADAAAEGFAEGLPDVDLDVEAVASVLAEECE
ncbi:hypothetical protein [Nocardiopsis tropica]|uniref:hypothetical protein n=1 Tax=Nocardiopsis tropica TaxID=109330 RepID=UPI002E7ABBE7|nr:hypothetical protein [Nocardiopsis umidischolae]